MNAKKIKSKVEEIERMQAELERAFAELAEMENEITEESVEMTVEEIFDINARYSVLWIARNHSDKYEYRERSRIHKYLMNQMKF